MRGRSTRKRALLKSTISTSNDNSKKSPRSGFGWPNWPPATAGSSQVPVAREANEWGDLIRKLNLKVERPGSGLDSLAQSRSS